MKKIETLILDRFCLLLAFKTIPFFHLWIYTPIRVSLEEHFDLLHTSLACSELVDLK